MLNYLKQNLFFAAFVLITSCNFMQEPHYTLTNNRAKVLVMFSPDCPLCKNYTKDISELISAFDDEVAFYGVVSGTYYSILEVDSFLQSYNLPLDIIYDPDFSLSHQLGATITPEVFFIDENNNILYSGLFDNWLGELGRRRQLVTEYYLRDALKAYQTGEPIKIHKTKAIGCFIE